MVLLMIYEHREVWMLVNDHADVQMLLARGYKIPRVVTFWDQMREQMHMLGPI